MIKLEGGLGCFSKQLHESDSFKSPARRLPSCSRTAPNKNRTAPSFLHSSCRPPRASRLPATSLARCISLSQNPHRRKSSSSRVLHIGGHQGPTQPVLHLRPGLLRRDQQSTAAVKTTGDFTTAVANKQRRQLLFSSV